MAAKKEHLGIDELLALRDGTGDGDGLTESELHAATCPKCQALFSAIGRVERALSRAIPEGGSIPGCPEDWELAALVTGERAGEDAAGIRTHLSSCLPCMDREAQFVKALVAAGAPASIPASWKRAAESAILASPSIRTTTEAKPAAEEHGFLRRLFSKLGDRFPLLPPLPGYAAAAAALILLVAWTQFADRGRFVTIPSSERVALKNGGSMGFMGRADLPEPVKVSVKVERSRVLFQWENPKGFAPARFRISELPRGREMTFPQGLEKKAYFSREVFRRDKLYAWVLEGVLEDGEVVEFSGRFVFVE